MKNIVIGISMKKNKSKRTISHQIAIHINKPTIYYIIMITIIIYKRMNLKIVDPFFLYNWIVSNRIDRPIDIGFIRKRIVLEQKKTWDQWRKKNQTTDQSSEFFQWIFIEYSIVFSLHFPFKRLFLIVSNNKMRMKIKQKDTHSYNEDRWLW